VFLEAFSAVYGLARGGFEGNLCLLPAIRADGIMQFSAPKTASIRFHSFHLAPICKLDSKLSEAKNENLERTFFRSAYSLELTPEIVSAASRYKPNPHQLC
jgi:hypothetical protein